MDKKGKKGVVPGRVWAALLVCIICLFCVGCSGRASVVSYMDAKNGVAVVCEYVTLDEEEVASARGSGFFIGIPGENPQYLVTNHHVIEDYLYFGAGQKNTLADEYGISHVLKSYVRVYYDSSDYEEAYVVAYDEVADVAVLRLASPTDKRKALTLCSPDNDMVGSMVYAIGYPAISDNFLVDSTSTWSLDDVTLTSGIISRLTTTSGTGVRSIQIDVTIGHGNSGGPLVNGNGQVLGVNTWGVNRNGEEVKYAVNIDEVIPLLDRYNVPYVSGDPSGRDWTIFIAVGIGVLAVIAIAVFVLIKGKRKKSAQGGGKPEPKSGQAAFSPTESVSAASVVPAAPVTTAPVPAAPSSPSSPSPQDSGYRLQGISGALEGRRFMIRKDTSLTLGRNPEVCNVVYPADTAGVSSRHCQIFWDHGNIYIKDLGSSHGTFLGSGVKLSSGQPLQLKPGEAFSLGSEKETMVLVQKGDK